MEKCKHWIGLEVPAAYDCELREKHSGPHRAKVVGSVPDHSSDRHGELVAGKYKDATATIEWWDYGDGNG